MRSWLQSLELEEYAQVFQDEGFERMEDIPNLKQLDEQQLKKMGIIKRGIIIHCASGNPVFPLLTQCNKPYG